MIKYIWQILSKQNKTKQDIKLYKKNDPNLKKKKKKKPWKRLGKQCTKMFMMVSPGYINCGGFLFLFFLCLLLWLKKMTTFFLGILIGLLLSMNWNKSHVHNSFYRSKEITLLGPNLIIYFCLWIILNNSWFSKSNPSSRGRGYFYF